MEFYWILKREGAEFILKWTDFANGDWEVRYIILKMRKVE